jgi:hypothetical protein
LILRALQLRGMMLAGKRIALFEVIQEAVNLLDAVMVHFGEVRFEADADSVKGFGPEHHAAQEQKRRSDRTRKQDSADAPGAPFCPRYSTASFRSLELLTTRDGRLSEQRHQARILA